MKNIEKLLGFPDRFIGCIVVCITKEIKKYPNLDQNNIKLKIVNHDQTFTPTLAICYQTKNDLVTTTIDCERRFMINEIVNLKLKYINDKINSIV